MSEDGGGARPVCDCLKAVADTHLVGPGVPVLGSRLGSFVVPPSPRIYRRGTVKTNRVYECRFYLMCVRLICVPLCSLAKNAGAAQLWKRNFLLMEFLCIQNHSTHFLAIECNNRNGDTIGSPDQIQKKNLNPFTPNGCG